ncbi:bifunctional nicotinamide-nucleotide adenylyltransferase/Nudix hydroxylase [Moraxella marmotae]|uniref:bifunctional nicotinamide-nucleotide adenylyltransferase/Nudix hydroxylase n=1 Tax=Moraxella marmotae TaxID=3344520 RepID=UPI0035F375DB
MSLAQLQYLVFIGRFQPFHQGHRYVIERALCHAKQVIVLIGSANAPRTPKNPFSLDERREMILGSFDAKARQKIHCVGINDATYNDNKWLLGVQSAIQSIATNTKDEQIAIIGHIKDDSSYYLSLFPQYRRFVVDSHHDLSATPIRQAYFGDDDAARRAAYEQLTDASADFLQRFIQTPSYQYLKQQVRHIKDYQDAWQAAPYTPSFITADALIVQSGHLLLIERGGEYGQGLYALPGGFVDCGEDFFTACIREIYEETLIKLDKQTLINSCKFQRLFDAPDRSQRGRTVTMAYYFELPHAERLPTVQGSDDANRAFWLPLSQLDAAQMFEDHYGIICQMLGI